MRVRFSKMHGAGNDFVVVNLLEGGPIEDLDAFARHVLDRSRGVGGDQLLLVQPSREADFFMGIRNPDGSTAEMCANGIRVFLKYLRDHGLTSTNSARIETLAGVVTPRQQEGGEIEVEMVRPVLAPEKIPTTLRDPDERRPLVGVPLEVDGLQLDVTPVSMGNPHCVLFVEDPERAPVERLGPAIERHPAFPQRTNVEFVAVVSEGELVQRTWERGTGETLACGSGACASAVAGVLAGRSGRDVRIRLRGGILRVRWPRDDGPVWLTGPAVQVFEGELDLP
ncbi:MAG: diaminopimelate epimerase [Myxococcota bacterium]